MSGDIVVSGLRRIRGIDRLSGGTRPMALTIIWGGLDAEFEA